MKAGGNHRRRGGCYKGGGRNHASYRDQLRTRCLRSAKGPIKHSAPQARDRPDSFRSNIRGKPKGCTEPQPVEMYARGPLTGNVGGSFCDDNDQALLSGPRVSDVTERGWGASEAFFTLNPSVFEVLCLNLEGVADPSHPKHPREAILCARTVCVRGKKIPVPLAPGTKEDLARCQVFLQEMEPCRLRDPLVLVTDGTPELVKAMEVCCPVAPWQRQLRDDTRNLQSKLTEARWPQLRAQAQTCQEAPLVKLGKLRGEDFAPLHQGKARQREEVLRGGLRCLRDAPGFSDHAPQGDPHHPIWSSVHSSRSGGR